MVLAQNAADIVRTKVGRPIRELQDLPIERSRLQEMVPPRFRNLDQSARQNTPARRLAESYNRNVLVPSRNNSPRRARRALQENVERHCHRLTASWRGGSQRINGADGIDIDDFQRRIGYFSQNTRLGEALRILADPDRPWNQRIAEDVASALDDSQYSRYLDTVIRLGTLEMAETASVAPILALLGRVQVGYGQQTLASLPVLVDIKDEIDELAVNQDTPFLGLGDPVEVTLPLRKKIKFAYAISREMGQGTNLNETIRSVMSQGAQLLDRYWAPDIIQLMFDVFAAAADNEWAYTLDGVKWRNYYQKQTTKGETPYENLLYLNEDIVRRNYGWAIAVEELMDGMEDMRTGDPISPDNLQTIVTGRQQSINVMEALGAIKIARAVGGPENETIEIDRMARDGWAPLTQWTPWTFKYLDALYQVVENTWTRDERKQVIDRSLVVGNTQRAFTIQTEWAREEMDLPTQWTNFNREIIWGRKFMEKTGLGTTNPQAVVCIKGLRDGDPIPAADPSPI